MKKFLLFVAFMVGQVLSQSHYLNAAEAIPTIGTTADGKYPIYQLEGELTDVNYKSGETLWTSGDLLTRIGYVDQADVNNNGYSCGFVCKDYQGHIVGIAPVYKQFQVPRNP